jgi:hypothetical protein
MNLFWESSDLLTVPDQISCRLLRKSRNFREYRNATGTAFRPRKLGQPRSFEGQRTVTYDISRRIGGHVETVQTMHFIK